MAASKLSALSAGSGLSLSDLMLVTKSPLGTPTSVSSKMSRSFALAGHVCNVRLSASSSIVVTTSDVTAATSFYLHPAPGTLPIVRLYDGTDWDLYSFTPGTSVSLSGLGDSVRDVFLYPSSGSVAVELVAWTNTTTRATALSTFDGILCKAGAATRLYVGSIRTVSSTTTDGEIQRHVFSYYNQYPRRTYRQAVKGGSTAYSTGAWRYYDNNSDNNFEYLCGWVERPVLVLIGSDVWGGGGYVAVGIGSSTGQAPAVRNLNASLITASQSIPFVPSVGLNTYYATEYGAAGFNSSSCYLQGLVWS